MILRRLCRNASKFTNIHIPLQVESAGALKDILGGLYMDLQALFGYRKTRPSTPNTV